MLRGDAAVASCFDTLAVLTGIDHVILAATDPDQVIAELEALLGLPAGGGGRHDAHGTYNRLTWLGDSYVELMGVFNRELAGASWWGVRMLDVIGRAGDRGGGYAGMAFACDDLETEIVRLRALGSAISDPIDGQRARPDGQVVRWRIARLPAPDPELGLLFLIEHDSTSAEWRTEDRAARAAEELPQLGRARLTRVELPVADVARSLMRLLRDLGLQFRPSLAGGGARDTSIASQTLRIRPAAGGASPTIGMRASALAEARHTTLLGCRWVIDPG
jgi:hypothetical protein